MVHVCKCLMNECEGKREMPATQLSFIAFGKMLGIKHFIYQPNAFEFKFHFIKKFHHAKMYFESN